ncbi:MAG: hypothetical protein ACRDY7_06740 [Acidimicrobiia bacterium]
MTFGPPDAEIFRQPGLAVERTFQPDPAWLADLCRWLRCPVGALGPTGWPIVLVPETVDARFRLSEQTLQAYQQVSWSGSVTSEPLTLAARVVWVSARGGSFEAGLRCRATLDGEEVAASLLVVRIPGEAVSWGTRHVEAPPDLGTARRRRSLVIDEETVRTFAELAGARYPVHVDQSYAWSRGYPNVLVQGLALLVTQLHFSEVKGPGSARMWFRHPVPAAAALEMCRSDDDPTVWAWRMVATGQMCVLARVESP